MDQSSINLRSGFGKTERKVEKFEPCILVYCGVSMLEVKLE